MNIKKFLQLTKAKLAIYSVFVIFEILIQFMDINSPDLITKIILLIDTVISLPAYIGLEIMNIVFRDSNFRLFIFILINAIYFYVLTCIIVYAIDKMAQSKINDAKKHK